jgi:probable rRNA maturation factor
MIEVVNRQRKLPLDCERWRRLGERALKMIGVWEAGVTVAFVSDRAMRELNRRWRGKRGTTDVLSFPAEQLEFERGAGATLGDVVISVERAERQAEENGLTLDEEIAQLIRPSAPPGLRSRDGYGRDERARTQTSPPTWNIMA